MKEQHAGKHVDDGGPGHGRTAHQQGSYGKHTGLFMAVIGVQCAHVLKEDDLTIGRKHSGNHDGDDAGGA